MLSDYLEALILSGLVGLSLGAVGSGGSIIATPMLVYSAHVPPENAVGMSLVIVGVTSLAGAFLNLRRGNVALRPVALFSLTGMAGSFFSSAGTHLISRRSLMLVFACIMLIVGLAMWRGRAAVLHSRSCSVYKCLAAGFAVGLLTGFLGIGGGFLIVPALVLFAGLDSRMAAGTSLAVIAFNSGIGVLGQLRFVQMDWSMLTGFLAFALAGMVAGTVVQGRLPELWLRRIVAVIVIAVGCAVGIENLAQ